MTRYSFAQLPQWVRKTERVMDAVVSTATSLTLEGIEIAPGISRGGTRKRGVIPRDLGALAGSLQSTLYGSSALSGQGEASWVLVAGRMQAGDVARFSWGGPAAPYARIVHDGARGVPGVFWIDTAAARWPANVREAVARAKAAVQ